MERRDDHDDLEEALRLFEADGDSSSFESWVMARVPLHQHERVRRVLSKATAPKPPASAKIKKLADAVVWYAEHGGEVCRNPKPNATLLLQASKLNGLKIADECQVLWNAIRAKRTDVNTELRRRGFKAN